MSTYVDEKLLPQRPSQGGKAQATRKQLLEGRRGAREQDKNVITIDAMFGREVWRRISPGVDGTYEQEVRS
jgi:hypothetical protein